MRLTDLSPRWVGVSDPTPRRRLGVTFDCPHCRTTRLGVFFANPLDGGERYVDPPPTNGAPPIARKHWQRTGETFETLTLTPSIDASADGHWHGHITNGEVR
ncbi:MAG: DUF6527 family protein [Polyangiales bacterium]